MIAATAIIVSSNRIFAFNAICPMSWFPELSLPLFARPSDVLAQFQVVQQSFGRVIFAAQVFFARNQFVNRHVTLPANRDRLLHLLSAEPLLEPFIGVASPRDEMMFGRAVARKSSAQFAS